MLGMKVRSSKTMKSCDASLQDFRQNGELCRPDSLVPMRFAIFPSYVSKVPRLPPATKK